MPAPGVPASVAVPSPLSTNVTPAGSAPVDVSVGVGVPIAVTVKVPALPTRKLVADGLEKRRPAASPRSSRPNTPLPLSNARKLASSCKSTPLKTRTCGPPPGPAPVIRSLRPSPSRSPAATCTPP